MKPCNDFFVVGDKAMTDKIIKKFDNFVHNITNGIIYLFLEA